MSADVTATFAAKDESFATTVNRLQQTLNGFGQNVQSFNIEFDKVAQGFTAAATKAATLVLGFIGVSSAFDGLKQSFNKAAEFQEMQRRFETLLGSTEAAQERMDELSKFMDRTPFELPGIVKANVALQNLTGGALATEKGMTQVGDAAAALGVPFDEMAQLIGRVHNSLEAGAPLGRYTNRLLELGVITPEVRRELEEMKNEVDSGKRGWELIERELSKFTGSMQRQSTTWNSTMSGFSDAVDNAMRAFATPLLPAFTQALQKVADKVRDDMAPAIEAAMNSFTTDWLPGILNAFTDMRNAADAFNQLMITGAKEFANAVFDNLSQAFRSAASGYEELMDSGSIAWLQTLEATWYVVADEMAVFFMKGIKGVLDLVSGIIPGAEAAAKNIAQQIAEATERIDKNMDAAKINANAALEAFNKGADKAEFIEHKLFDSSTSADKVAEYLERAKDNGAIPTEQAYAKIANTHAPEIKQLMEQVASTAQNSENSFAQIKLDLQSAETNAQNISIAFGNSEKSSGNLFSDLNSAEASAKGVDGWIGGAEKSSNKISIAGAEFETSAAAAADQISGAKVDAEIVADILSGPEGLTSKFNEAMGRTKELRDVIERFIVAGKDVAQNLERASRMDQNARDYERNQDRAHNLRERGHHRSANQAERNAQAKFVRDTIKEQMKQTAEDAKARAYERAEDAKSFGETLKQRMQADKEYRQTMEQLTRLTKEQLNEAAFSVSSAGTTAGGAIQGGGQAAAGALHEAANAVREALSATKESGQLALESTLEKCRAFLENIDKNLPQNSLSE